MKIAFSTLGCPGWSLEQIATAAQANGFDAVELRIHDDGEHLKPEAATKDLEKAKALFEAKGISIFSLSGYSKFVFEDHKEIEANQKLLTRLLDVAEILGAKYVRSFAGEIPAGMELPKAAERVAEALKPLAEIAAKKKLKIALETHDHWTSGAKLMEIIERVENPDGLGVLYDAFNAYHTGTESWAVTLQKLRRHIAYCHVKDAYQTKDGQWVYVMLGAGDLPWTKILQRLKREGFDGTLSFEWEKKWKPELEDLNRVLPQCANKLRKLWTSV